MCRLVQVESEWVPHDTSSSLYIRPTLIGTEPTLGVAPSDQARMFVLLCPVGPYYSTGFKPVNLLCDPSYVRAWPGGCGFAKMGSNYAPTLWTQKVTERERDLVEDPMCCFVFLYWPSLSLFFAIFLSVLSKFIL